MRLDVAVALGLSLTLVNLPRRNGQSKGQTGKIEGEREEVKNMNISVSDQVDAHDVAQLIRSPFFSLALWPRETCEQLNSQEESHRSIDR